MDTDSLPSENTPQYDEDEQMPDAPSPEPSSPQEGAEEDNGNEEEDDGTPAQESDAPVTPVPEPVPRKRRLGRPPKNRPADWDIQDVEGSEAGTPARRGRGRGGFGRGGRWARRGGPSHVTQQPIDKEGNMMDVINDEVHLPEDPEGETKVDKMGYLQDDRQYRCRTFTVLGRGTRLYMLSTEPARCVGFRDSYLFFTKHKRLFKIIIDDDEKRDLIERNLIPHSYKGRAIGIVTARSVFREFGAQIVVGGKRIIDDYEVAKAKAEGAVEGELADPNDRFEEGKPYNKNQYVAWHGASSVYHSGAPTVPTPGGKVTPGQKKKVAITDVNWMYEHAKAARYVEARPHLYTILTFRSEFNARIALQRRANLNGVYDIHTNQMHYPKIMQPTHARWEQIDDYEVQEKIENGEIEEPKAGETMFPPIDPVVSRNYMIIDTVFEAPPYNYPSRLVPGPDGDSFDIGFNGLSAVTDDVKDCLPPECREAFEEALEKETEWKSKWSGEAVDGHRRMPKIFLGQV
jgi:chromatin structure-remodeling complex protein RSC7